MLFALYFFHLCPDPKFQSMLRCARENQSDYIQLIGLDF